MNGSNRFLILGSLLLCLTAPIPMIQAAPAPALTGGAVKDLNTPRTFPPIHSRAEWQERAREIREQILVSCGLWPMPEKQPLQPHIFGRIERDGYSVEKVYFETYPGFYLAGNLYRPLGRGKGPFPGVLNPHGHWANGRLTDTKDGSNAARCITFARLGMVAFAYDMVGYNDTRFADPASGKPTGDQHRQFGQARTDQLWSISLMGLQTWDSIRALDFLASLPEVDKQRLACTGESGGGTQTFMLGAVDDRLALQAPIVMVSHTMQGGCGCENVSGLRVEYSNMEIAAAAAPRPQMFVAATGDWTRATMEVEGPAVESIYRLFGAKDHLRYMKFDYGHNYNQTSREAVYAWFARWLLQQPDALSLNEPPYQKEPDADLRVFLDGKLPADAVSAVQLAESLRQTHRAGWESLVPRSRNGFEKFKRIVQPMWRHTLMVNWPQGGATSKIISNTRGSLCEVSHLEICPPGAAGKLSAVCIAPLKPASKRGSKPVTVVIADSAVAPARYDESGQPIGLAKKLSERGYTVLAIESYSSAPPKDQFGGYFATYNRTHVQERVRDLITACSEARRNGTGKRAKIVLCGLGKAGLWSLLAAPGADAVIADCAGVETTNDEGMLEVDLFCPGIRNIGTFEGAAMLAAPHPLLLNNAAANFPVAGIQSAYQALGARQKFCQNPDRLSDEALVKWVSEL